MTDQTPPSTDPADYVWIRTTVEYPGGIDEEFNPIPRADWDAMTPKQRESECVEMAVEHQNNVAPCGGSPVDLDQVPDDFRNEVGR